MSDVNVPGYLESSLSYVFTAIYSALEDTSPIPMSVNAKDVEENADATRAVLFKAKIHVPRNKRTEIRDKIVENLNRVLDKDTTADFKGVFAGTKTGASVGLVKEEFITEAPLDHATEPPAIPALSATELSLAGLVTVTLPPVGVVMTDIPCNLANLAFKVCKSVSFFSLSTNKRAF